MNYHFKTEREEYGYSAYCIELEGCRSEGDSIEELRLNLTEALNLYLDEPAGSNMLFPLPDSSINSEKNVIKINVDPEIAFAQIMRQYRISRHMTQAEAQEAIGFKNRTSYARLERKGNPRLNTIAEVMRAFPDFPIMQCFS